MSSGDGYTINTQKETDDVPLIVKDEQKQPKVEEPPQEVQ